MSIPDNTISISNWVCLYPVYFDSTKTVQRGRRVIQKEAVKHPLAKDIAEAVKSLGLNSAFEVIYKQTNDFRKERFQPFNSHSHSYCYF